MRVQKHPHPQTLAATWPTLSAVPPGVQTEEMTDAEFAAWLAAQPPVPRQSPVPVLLPSWRILAVLDLHGYTAAVEEILDGLPNHQKAVAKRQIAGANIERGHALVLAVQQALGLTDAQIDDLFREADALT